MQSRVSAVAALPMQTRMVTVLQIAMTVVLATQPKPILACVVANVTNFEKKQSDSGYEYSGTNELSESDYYTLALDTEIVASMIYSARRFVLKEGHVNNLKKHVEARMSIVDFASEKKYGFATDFSKVRLGGKPGHSGKYWEFVKKDKVWHIRRKPDTDVREAYEDFNRRHTEYAVGCEAATKITQRGGISRVSYNIGLDEDANISDARDWVPGDAGYINNILKNSGAFAGQNIIYQGRKSWWGHAPKYVKNPAHISAWMDFVNGWENSKAELTGTRVWPAVGLR